MLTTTGLIAQDDVYFVETDTLHYKLNSSSEMTRGMKYPALYKISEYKAVRHRFYYTYRMQPYYMPVNQLSANSYYNSALYEPIGIRGFSNYLPSIGRYIAPLTGKPRTTDNVSHKDNTHTNQAKKNTAGRTF